jgi:hypothetical protein
MKKYKGGKNLPNTHPAKLSDNEQEALDLLKSNIEDWLKNQLKEGQTFSNNHTLVGNQEAVFEQFTGKEEVHPKRHRPLLLQALKEVVEEYEE